MKIISYIISIMLAGAIIFMVLNHKPIEGRIAGVNSTKVNSTGGNSTGGNSTGDYSTGDNSAGENSTGDYSTGDYSTGEETTAGIPEKEKTLYDKIKDRGVVRVLIIGDGVAQGDGADSVDNRWFNLLSKRMDKQLGVSFIYKFVTNQQSTAFSSWVDYKSVEKQLQYISFDLVFICLGQTRESLGIEAFTGLYECLVRQVRSNNPDAELVAVVESAVQDSEYIAAISKISNYYDMLFLNMKEVFDKSGQDKSKLYYYENHPSNSGYALYSQTVFNLLKSNLDSGRSPGKHEFKPFLTDNAGKFGTINVNTNFKERKGFNEHLEAYLRNYMFASNPGDFIEGSFRGSVFGVSTISDIDCGYMNIYIDGKLYREYNCYLDFGARKLLLVADNLEAGDHSFKIEVASKKDPESLRNTIYIDSVISNDVYTGK